MNRIAQRPFPASVLTRLTADHRLLVGVLQRSLPPSYLSLFPTPGPGSATGSATNTTEAIQWQSPVAGQPKVYDELAPVQAQQALQTLTQKRAAIDQAITQQESAGQVTPDQAQRLRAMISDIPTQALVVVGSEPMVLYWASALAGNEGAAGAAGVSLLPLPALASLTAATAATAGSALASEETAHRRRGGGFLGLAPVWWWLLAVLLVLLLAALWWLYCPLSPRQAPSLNDPSAPPLTQEELTITVPPPTPLDPAELWNAPEVPLAPDAPEPEPEPEPPPEPEPKPKPEPAAKKAAPPEKVTITNAKEFCPGQRPASLAPELVIVFDASGSMRLNIGVTMAQEREYVNALRQQITLGFITGQRNRMTAQMEREPTRITVAKQSVTDVVNRLPSDVNVGLVTARACPTAHLHGFFKPSERSALVSQVQRLQPEQGTPLADSIRRAASLLDGKGRESTILVVTDGQESCGSDPCAAARALAAAKPHLTINVLDIGRGGGGNCMAQATGGKVYTATNAADLRLGLERAVQEVQGPSNCQ